MATVRSAWVESSGGWRLASVIGWEARRRRIAGRVMSLEELERDGIGSRFVEPRIEVAWVGAADGCPPRRHGAWSGGESDARIVDPPRCIHALPDWLRVDPKSVMIALSPVYEWYAEDFESADDSLAEAARHSAAARDRLDRRGRPAV